MGQRSQIYIRHKDGHNVHLIARYFHWNYGIRMVSRARVIIEWLTDYLVNDNDVVRNRTTQLERICDVNFDMRDVCVSTDIKAEIVEQFFEEAQQNLTQFLFGMRTHF